MITDEEVSEIRSADSDPKQNQRIQAPLQLSGSEKIEDEMKKTHLFGWL